MLGFFKKTFHKNKKFHHIFKYCFLPSRGFTNAAVSNQLIRNGIRTPKVFLCAERKKNIFSIPVILENSYMISEALDSKELSELIPQVLSDPRTVAQFLANWGGCIRKIHEAGVYHGDMKTSNFFFDKTENPNSDRLEKLEENIGVWDLDCSKIYEGSVPEKEKIRDVGRAFSSFLLVVDGLLGNSDSSGISKEDFSRKIPLFLIIFCESTETDLKKVVGKLFSYWFKTIQLKNINLAGLKN